MVDQTGRSSARYLTQLARSASLARSDSTASGAKGPLVLPYDRSKSVFGTNASFAGRNKVRATRAGSLAPAPANGQQANLGKCQHMLVVDTLSYRGRRHLLRLNS